MDVGEGRRAIARSEDIFRLLVDSVEEYAIFVLDPDGLVASWNTGAERLYGCTLDEIIGQHFRTFYLPDDILRRHPEHELEVARTEGRYAEEGWRLRKDGAQFWASIVITPLRDDDGVIRGFAKVTRDATARREVEESLSRANDELRRANEAKSQFLATTAHELANPLVVIGGSASTMRDLWERLDDETRRRLLDGITQQTTHLARLVADLSTAARIDMGRVDVQVEPVTLISVVNEAIAGVPELEPGVELDFDEALGVIADPGRLRQILANYLANASRYGEPPIAVRAEAYDGHVAIRVCDSGTGVSEEFAARLFLKFERDPDRAREVHGTGLGLFIVRGLAESMGGEAWYEANEPQGACFGVRLPRS